MRHCFVTQDYGPDLGGMARRHVELCRRFPPGTICVSTVAAENAAAFDRGEPYPIDRQPFPFRRANRFVNQMRWAWWLAHRTRGDEEPIACLHCGNVRPVGYATWWAHRRTGVPYLLYVNGGDVLREVRKTAASAMKRATARRIFADAAGIVANSPWTAGITGELMRTLGIAAAPPIAAIDLGTDPVQFAPARDRRRLRARFGIGDAPLLVTVARLVPHKGQDVAITALARLTAHRNAHYLLVGDGHDGPRLRAQADALGVAPRVHFAGSLSDEDVAEAYATADVYVGPSRLDRGINVEGFGISFVEAAASGVPSVAGDSGGVRAAVRDGETGFVVPPEDADAVAAAIASLLGDRARRDAMGARARALVETHYNWDRVARDTVAFAEEALRRAAARGARAARAAGTGAA